MKRWLALLGLATLLAWAPALPASAATLVAKVSLSTQTMTVLQNGKVRYTWRVSTARDGKVTPTGSWTAKRFARFHRSSRYGNAPMPYSIFYSGNFSVHGTNATSQLGNPASAGCIRLSRKNARTLFSMAKQAGLRNTRVVVER